MTNLSKCEFHFTYPAGLGKLRFSASELQQYPDNNLFGKSNAKKVVCKVFGVEQKRVSSNRHRATENAVARVAGIEKIANQK